MNEHPATLLRCVVERITYQNPENGYSVLKVKVKGYNDLVTLVGNLLEVPVGSVLLCRGEWKVDKCYGSQFVAATWEETMPATVYGIEKYLGSGLVKGIGPRFARAIVQRFGTETIDIIETEIERLYEVPNIGRKRVAKIRESWEKQKDIKNVMLFLQGYGVSTAYAAKIYREYGKESIDKVRENPYRLADDIWGIGFKTADGIAAKMGYEKEDPRRCRSGILYTLGQLSDEGHVYAGEEQLVKTAGQLLEAGETAIRDTLAGMLQAEDLILDKDAIYLPPFYHAECGTSRRLRDLAESTGRSLFDGLFDPSSLTAETGIEYDEVQLAAIRQAVTSKVMVLTGGPGTGKTTTTQGIIAALKKAGLRVLLAAPTGRAAKRMSEATGMEAKTIHRLLEYNPQDGYKRNDENPLEGDALIVDECSMIDILLMNNLLKAVPVGMRLVFVGDIDQLPSVGAGNVFGDLIRSERVATVALKDIFRQAEQSAIVRSAHLVNEGRLPELQNTAASDFFFLPRRDSVRLVDTVVGLCRTRLPEKMHIPAESIQVLTATRKGDTGTAALNRALQAALNPAGAGRREKRFGDLVFREGDRVMQTRNDYDVLWEREDGTAGAGIFNGDVGKILQIDPSGELISIAFDDRVATYTADMLAELDMAYAMTVHKAQGSEYRAVIFVSAPAAPGLMVRGVLYTAITRARELLILVGDDVSLGKMAANDRRTRRYSGLRWRLGNGGTA